MKQLQDPHRGAAPGRPHDPGGGVEPTLNLTYRFHSRISPRAENSHTLSIHTVVDEYPTALAARRALVRVYGPYLMQEWVRRGLPLGELFHLVHRPGELGPAEGLRLDGSDQGSAPAAQYGGVPVVIVLANTALRPDMVVSQVRFD